MYGGIDSWRHRIHGCRKKRRGHKLIRYEGTISLRHISTKSGGKKIIEGMSSRGENSEPNKSTNQGTNKQTLNSLKILIHHL